MTENEKGEPNTEPTTPKQETSTTVVLRIPKLNLQIVALGAIAIVTIFQTVQLARISAGASSATSKAAAPATTTTTTSAPSGTGSNADVPQSMVGGC